MSGAARTAAPKGLLLGCGAYLAWGLFPLYFKLLKQVPVDLILAHRIAWSLLFLVALVGAMRRGRAILAALRAPRVAGTLLLTALLVGGNWLLYIYAVIRGHVVDASLGYFATPLVNVVLGTLLLKERLSSAKRIAAALAAAGVVIFMIGDGVAALWLSAALAVTFAIYGVLRKTAPVAPVDGVVIETACLAPLAVGWLVFAPSRGVHPFPGDQVLVIALVGGSALTAVPLLLFNAAAKQLPYSTLAFLQYISPTIQLVLGVALYGEPITVGRGACFVLVWAALATAFLGPPAVKILRSFRSSARRSCRSTAE